MSEFIDKINSLIGKPYDLYEAHCYNLVMDLIPDAPKVEFVADSLYKSIKQIDTTIKDYRLQPVNKYRNKDIILLGRNGVFHHVGVYYDGGVVHADKNGVIYEKMSRIKLYYSHIKGIRI